METPWGKISADQRLVQCAALAPTRWHGKPAFSFAELKQTVWAAESVPKVSADQWKFRAGIAGGARSSGQGHSQKRLTTTLRASPCR